MHRCILIRLGCRHATAIFTGADSACGLLAMEDLLKRTSYRRRHLGTLPEEEQEHRKEDSSKEPS